MSSLFTYQPSRLPGWLRSQDNFPLEDEPYQPPIIAKEFKDVPDWMKAHHGWETPADVKDLLRKSCQLEVKMCCRKCAEIVEEKIMEVHGVFDVHAEHLTNKVVVVPTTNGLDEHKVLMKAKKIHKKARFVPLEVKETKKKPDGSDKDKATKQEKELQTNTSKNNSNIVLVDWNQQLFWPLSSNEPRYIYQPTLIQHYPNPNYDYVQFL